MYMQISSLDFFKSQQSSNQVPIEVSVPFEILIVMKNSVLLSHYLFALLT